MSSTRFVRLSLAVTGALLLPGAALTTSLPATAAADARPAAPLTHSGAPAPLTHSAAAAPLTHPAADHMGSTLRAHEPAPAAPQLTAPAAAAAVAGKPRGMDVSSFQGNVNWAAAARNGARFAYVKATESTVYRNPFFAQQYNGSARAGMLRGAYHFALPNRSRGATQANYFVDHGGGWAADGRTLPPMLDIEYTPYGPTCYGLSGAAMSAWIAEFSRTVAARTGRFPTIYTTRNWWNTCTRSNSSFGRTNPLFIANYASTPGPMPAGWGFQTLWQFSDRGIFPGDQDVFNGSFARLQVFAR